jgi:hypothetical protein
VYVPLLHLSTRGLGKLTLRCFLSSWRYHSEQKRADDLFLLITSFVISDRGASYCLYIVAVDYKAVVIVIMIISGVMYWSVSFSKLDSTPFRFYTSWVRRFVGQISRPLCLTLDFPASLPDGSGCWIRMIRMCVLGRQTSHLLLIRTNYGYGAVLTAACARQGCSASGSVCLFFYFRKRICDPLRGAAVVLWVVATQSKSLVQRREVICTLLPVFE